MDEIPTVAVKSLGQGTCDECYHGFVVMNRPWALLQFTQSRAYVEIEEQFIFVMETVRSRRILPIDLGELCVYRDRGAVHFRDGDGDVHLGE